MEAFPVKFPSFCRSCKNASILRKAFPLREFGGSAKKIKKETYSTESFERKHSLTNSERCMMEENKGGGLYLLGLLSQFLKLLVAFYSNCGEIALQRYASIYVRSLRNLFALLKGGWREQQLERNEGERGVILVILRKYGTPQYSTRLRNRKTQQYNHV